MASRRNVSGLPRRQPQATTNELPGGVAHNHGDDDAHHIHRLGNITHTHDEDGRPVFEGDDGQPVTDDGQPLPAEGPGKDQFGSVPDVGYIEPDPPPTDDELVAAEQEQAAEAHALAVPDQPRPVEVSGRLGADLGGFELIKASYKALFPTASDEMATEYALTMGISDVIGRMLGYHRKPAVADRGLVSDLFTLAGQIEQVRRVQAP
jgi:hypothetical protein